MPYINVTVTGRPNPTLSARIAEQVTELTKLHLRKDPTATAVSVSYVDPRHWFAGSKSLATMGMNTFWLDIKVVDGSNTKLEIAAYLEDMFATLSDTIGGVHEASYLLVHEVPAAAYGFGGKTQDCRLVASRMKPAA
jgi:4-oxalocrotonate tautomerase